MSAMPEITPDDDVLVKLDRAHKAYEATLRSYQDDLDKESARLAAKHNPFIWSAQSVLYEAMGAAGFAGFSPAEMVKTMGCSQH